MYSKSAHPPLPIPALMAGPLVALRQAGGRPLIVGGAVRDHLLRREPKDLDVETFGLSLEAIAATLRPFGKVDTVGEAFGVVKLFTHGAEYDFSIPRRDQKTGVGHRGFSVVPDPTLTLHQAAERRDFTLNAIYYDPATNEVLDPLGGLRDLRAGVLRHTGPAFAEDPLRVLRGFQFASRFNFTVAPETVELSRQLKGEFHSLPLERVWAEWEKWAKKGIAPEKGLRFLEECDWLENFPLLHALRSVPQQPEWHPEGDALTHTFEVLKALRRSDRPLPPEQKLVVTFALLCHDLGKATHTQVNPDGKITSHGHEKAGEPLAKKFLASIGAPKALSEAVEPLVGSHMWHSQFSEVDEGHRARAVRRMAHKLHPATLEQLCWVMEADVRGRPPLPDVCPTTVPLILALAHENSVAAKAPVPLLLGRHLLLEGLKPGPALRPILNAALDAQLEGRFSDIAGGLKFLREQDLLPVLPAGLDI